MPAPNDQSRSAALQAVPSDDTASVVYLNRRFQRAHKLASQTSVFSRKGHNTNMFDLSNLEEMLCPVCQRPFVAEPVEGKPNAYKFVGCRCDQNEFSLPETVGMVGAEGGLMFFVRRKSRT